MLLLGFRTDVKGMGRSENDYSSSYNQVTDIIDSGDDANVLKIKYDSMVKQAEESRKKLVKLNDELEWSDISEKEYERLSTKYETDIRILKYEKVIIVDGVVLK